MIYLWIFVGSYLLVGGVAFYFLSQRAAAEASAMRDRGIPQHEIDRWYAGLGGMTIRAVLQSMLISGTMLAGLASLIAWLATK